jgi:hypothetical protein
MTTIEISIDCKDVKSIGGYLKVINEKINANFVAGCDADSEGAYSFYVKEEVPVVQSQQT